MKYFVNCATDQKNVVGSPILAIALVNQKEGLFIKTTTRPVSQDAIDNLSPALVKSSPAKTVVCQGDQIMSYIKTFLPEVGSLEFFVRRGFEANVLAEMITQENQNSSFFEGRNIAIFVLGRLKYTSRLSHKQVNHPYWEAHQLMKTIQESTTVKNMFRRMTQGLSLLALFEVLRFFIFQHL